MFYLFRLVGNRPFKNDMKSTADFGKNLIAICSDNRKESQERGNP